MIVSCIKQVHFKVPYNGGDAANVREYLKSGCTCVNICDWRHSTAEAHNISHTGVNQAMNIRLKSSGSMTSLVLGQRTFFSV